MDTLHLVFEISVAVALTSAGVWFLSVQARRNRDEVRAVLDRQSESLALQAELAASRARKRVSTSTEKGNLNGMRLY